MVARRESQCEARDGLAGQVTECREVKVGGDAAVLEARE
jgi:hypothetical protein